MATERQIQANRANAQKSTGPKTPEGKRISSQNAGQNVEKTNAAHGLISGTIVLKGESMPRFNDLATALTQQFQPRNSAETALVQTMIAARWRLLRMWGIQSASFQLEMARQDPSAGSGAVLAAITFRSLAESSSAFALQHRFEATYDRQYNRALAMLLKLRRSDPSAATYPPIHLATETWEDDFQNEPNFDTEPEEESRCDE